MKILLDESIPQGLRHHLPGCVVSTVRREGWSGVRDGELLCRASTVFDILITADQNLPNQQNIQKFDIFVLVLVARRNRLPDYIPLLSRVEAVLAETEPRTVKYLCAEV